MGFGIFFGITGIFGSIIGAARLKSWKKQKEFEGRIISWNELIFCGVCTAWKELQNKKKGGQEVFSVVTPEISSESLGSNTQEQDNESLSSTSEAKIEV